jgi:hypothetical protein
MVYTNIFTGTLRKFVNGTGYVSNDNGNTWSKNNTSEALVKSLPYYKA